MSKPYTLRKRWESAEVKLPAGSVFKKEKNGKYIYSNKPMNLFWLVSGTGKGVYLIEEYSGYCPC